ncbi:hypothetical protein [Sphingomonas montanisoli]|uniref:Uncharacterized protein n=1 Tax=Sphingomonas montanisoli TaxID=2606412 RepID=A0A5D9C3D9_9SPHN|nr:hypothetical protein [Sphingomonas montanisoli]TZG25802.1 hypothetical protein FYJ91_12480 [Sphingomonas montanisoli]
MIWLTYDPDSLEITTIRWFGGRFGEPMPALGDRIARRTRPNADGKKLPRTDHRVLTRSRFTILPDIGALADNLFGNAS